MSPTGSSPSSSMQCGLALVKRPRSVSPRDDDIYDEQQRKIFEAANSPEPQNIGAFKVTFQKEHVVPRMSIYLVVKGYQLLQFCVNKDPPEQPQRMLIMKR